MMTVGDQQKQVEACSDPMESRFRGVSGGRAGQQREGWGVG